MSVAIGPAVIVVAAGAGWGGGSMPDPPGGTGGAPPRATEAAAQPPGCAQQPTASMRRVPALVDVATEVGLQGAHGAVAGIVFTAGGQVLTDDRVVEGAARVRVTDVGNDRSYRATVIGYDRGEGVAVLRSVASDLAGTPLGDSGSATAAAPSYRIGPFGGADAAGDAGAEGFAVPIDRAARIADRIVAGDVCDTVHIGSAALLVVPVGPVG